MVMLSSHIDCIQIFYAIVAYKRDEESGEIINQRCLTPNGVWKDDALDFVWTWGEACREWDARVLRSLPDFPTGYIFELLAIHSPCGEFVNKKSLELNRD